MIHYLKTDNTTPCGFQVKPLHQMEAAMAMSYQTIEDMPIVASSAKSEVTCAKCIQVLKGAEMKKIATMIQPNSDHVSTCPKRQTIISDMPNGEVEIAIEVCLGECKQGNLSKIPY